MRKPIWKSLAFMLLAVPFWSYAASSSHAYFGAQGGWSVPDNQPNAEGYTTSNKGYTYGGNIGYTYSFKTGLSTGVEANYLSFGKTNYTGSGSLAASSGTFKNSAIQVLLTGTYLMNNGFNTFLKVGAARENTNYQLSNNAADVTTWLPAIAAGLGYEMIQNFNVYAEYERTLGKNWENATPTSHPEESASLNAFTMGVNYTLPI